MKEPFIAVYRIYQCSLVRSVYDTVPLMKHIFLLIRSVNVFGAQNHLPSGLYTACRSKNVIISVSLIYLWSLNRRLCLKSTVEDMVLPRRLCSIP